MRAIWLIFFLITGTVKPTYSDSYDDCVLGGMKGISSDVAAKSVTQACRNKFNETRKSRESEFGETILENEYDFKVGYNSEIDGFLVTTLKNTSSYKTITYVSLVMRNIDFYEYKGKDAIRTLESLLDKRTLEKLPLEKNDYSQSKVDWEKERTTKIYYKLTLKPGQEIKLLYRKPRVKTFYPDIETVMAREKKWSDTILVGGTLKPEPKNPLE